MRHSGNANVVYQIPFGAGKTYLSQPGIMRDVFGSRELASIVSAHTGLPVNITVDRSSSALPDGNSNNQRPNLVPGVSLIPPGGSTVGDWINLAAFSVPAAGTWGDLPRDFARGRGRGKRILGYREISTKERGSQSSSEPRCSIFLIIRSGARRSQTFRLERGRSAGLSRF
jgi:hypothetical protein